MNYFKALKIKQLPIILNIPHASTNIGSDFAKDFLLPAGRLEKFSKNMADLYADELFSGMFRKTGALISQLSRVAVDTERFWENKKEPMSKAGMGALYEKDEQGRLIRKVSKDLLARGYQYYTGYHRELNRLTGQCLKRFGCCVIIDCHTYPSKPRGYDLDQSGERPEICLGTDRYHTPESLIANVERNLILKKFSVGVDVPFKGTMVPSNYFRKNKRVFSLMIEVKRGLYMDERGFKKKKNFGISARKLSGCLLTGVGEFIKMYGKK